MVNTIDSLAPACWTPTTPERQLLATLRAWFARRSPRPASAPSRHDELIELDAHTLADIGAPEYLLDRAMARCEVQRQEREGLALGLAAGAWQHW